MQYIFGVRAIAPLFLDEKSQRFLFPFISCEDKNKEKRSLFEVGEIEKITKNQTKFAFYK